MHPSHRGSARRTGRAVGVTLLALAALTAGVPGAAPRWRLSPMSVVSADTSGGVVIAGGRIEDAAVERSNGSSPPSGRIAARIRRFLFTVEAAPSEAGRLHAALSLKSWDGRSSVYGVDLPALASGSTFEIPAARDVPGSEEGPFTADLELRSASGAVLNVSRFAFGLPRYGTTSDLRLIARNVPIRDDFDAASLDRGTWKLVQQNPDRSTVRQREGRLWIESTGPIGYNGVRSQEIPSRDVEMICRAGIDAPGADHSVLLHLCGNGANSPDNWLEIKLFERDAEGRVAVAVSVPAPLAAGAHGPLALAGSPAEGATLKITSDAFTHRARGYLLAPEGWVPIGDAFEIPARASRMELKIEGWVDPGHSSRAWFDDCRMYPRAASSYVTVKLARRGGSRPGAMPGGKFPPIAFDADNRRFGGGDVMVRLYAEDGTTLEAEASPSGALDYALLPLSAAAWQSYPVPAILRVFLRGEQIGPDHVIDVSGLDGLYPDDVYVLHLE